MKNIESYIEYNILNSQYLIEKIDKKTGQKIIDKSSIPIDKQIQALAKDLYKAAIDSVQFKYNLKDKIKKMKSSGASEDDVADAQEMGDDQLTKMETAVQDIEMQMIALAGDNSKLANKAEIWAGEAKTLAAKRNQEFFDKRAKDCEKQGEKSKEN